LEFRECAVWGSACAKNGFLHDDSANSEVLLIKCLQRNGTFDKEFVDTEEYSGIAGSMWYGKLDISDKKAFVFDDLGGADLNIEVGILFSEFGEDVFLDFVVDSGIDEESSHCCSDDGEQCSPTESNSD